MSNTPPISPVGGGQRVAQPLSRSSSVSSLATTSTNLTIHSHVSGSGPSHAPIAAPGASNSPLTTANPATRPPGSGPQHTNSSNTPPGNAVASGSSSSSNPRQATWGISWVQPTWMIAFVVFGILLALGHHLYYNSLNGSIAGSASRQQWPIRFGTAFAYLTTSCLNAAVGLAFTQQLWQSVRRKSFSINSIDKMFSITTDPTSFLSWEVLSRAKIVSLLALLVWLIPFAAIIPPATLTVGIVAQPKTHDMAFGVPNWNSVNLLTPGSGDVAPVPSDVMLRIAFQAGERSDILPIPAPAINSSFDISFFGPTVQCATANEAQKGAFEFYAARIHNESSLYVASNTQDIPPASDAAAGPNLLELFYSGFSPRLSELTNDPSVDLIYNNWTPELGAFSPSNPLRQGVLQDALLQELWIALADQSIVCQLANASYDVHIDYLNGAQTVSINSVEALDIYNQTYLAGSDADCADWDNEAYCTHIYLSSPQYNYIAWYGALSYLLNGNITRAANSVTEAFNVTTRFVQQTGLASCPEIANGYWNQYCQSSDADKDFCTALDSQTKFFPQVEPYLCRNGSLARAVEDLANNITISLLSTQQEPWGSTVDDIDQNSLQNQGVLIPVTITTSVNVYAYDWRNLVISYAVAAALALTTVALGGLAFRHNGVSHASSFSALVAATRNPELDALAEGQCLGALPLPDDIGRTRVRFGVLGSPAEKVRHAAFGLEKSVQPLEKGAVCA